MIPSSLRWRLPLTYAGLALLTAVLLHGLLLITLHLYYQQLEQAYLFRSGLRGSAALATLLTEGAAPTTLAAQAEALAQAYDVRLRLRDSGGRDLLDTGAPALPHLPADPANFLEAAYGFDRLHRTSQAAEITLLAPASGQAVGVLTVSAGPAYGQDIVASVGRVGAAASLAAVLLAAAVGWVLSRGLVSPLLALEAASARMARGDLAARAQVARADEIGALAVSFNRMAGQLEGTVQTLRAFIADAAHELHTPLTALTTDLDLAADETNPARVRALLARARAQTARLAELSTDLLDLSRLEANTPAAHAALELTALVNEVAEAYASRAEQASLVFALEAPPAPVLVRGHEGQLRRAVSNLLDNALKFTPEGGALGLTLAVEGAYALITVRDSGIGIPAEDVPRLFGRFHRGRNAASYAGSGLGLAIVHAIITQHGGTVTVQSSPRGTSVTVSVRRE